MIQISLILKIVTKNTAKVICFLLVTVLLGILTSRLSFADYYLRPVPADPEGKNLVFVDNQPVANTPFSFGDILSGRKPEDVTITPTGENSKSEKLKEYLNKISSENRKVLGNFSQINSSNNSQSTTQNSNETGYYATHPTPSPLPTAAPTINYLANSLVITNNNPQLYSLPTDFPKPTDSIGNIENSPIKTTYTIAILGDSMVDTLGHDLSGLRQLLRASFPNYSFALLNYGQGSTDLDSGLYRLTNSTRYLDTDYPPLLSYKPDILVVESFAYNHWSGNLYDLDRQWLTIDRIIKTVKEKLPETKIILAASIAPNSKTFGDGKLNWPQDLKYNSAQITKAYLQNLTNFATSQGFPLADAYHTSLGPDGNGQAIFINQGDHLHPSNEGARLFYEKIMEAIKQNNIIK